MKAILAKIEKESGLLQEQLNDIKAYLYKFNEQITSLFNLKLQTGHDIVGLDIGSEYIKLLKINCTERPYKVEKFAITRSSIAIGAASKNTTEDHSALAAIIKDMFARSGITTKSVALAIPRSMAILKNITIDSHLSPEEIQSRAWLEAAHHFPDLVEEIYMDYFTSESASHDASRLDMTLVACRKSQIEPFLDVLSLAGLQPKIVDVDCYALERALPLATSEALNSDAIAMLNLNSNTSNLIVVKSGKLIYAHDQGYDGQRLLSQTNTYLKNKAASLKDNSAELLNDADYQEILKNNLISHLHHIMHFFSTSQSNIIIKKLILAGDCASVPGLVPFINQEMGIDTEVADLLTHLVLAPEINSAEFKQYSPELVLSCGLALSQTEY